MLRAFWPTTAYGIFALRLCVLVLGIFVLWGVIPVVSQQVFGVSLMEGIPGVVSEPPWYVFWVQPMLSIGLLGSAVASGVLAMVARWRYGDTGQVLFVVMVPFVLIVAFLVGELIPPYH